MEILEEILICVGALNFGLGKKCQKEIVPGRLNTLQSIIDSHIDCHLGELDM